MRVAHAAALWVALTLTLSLQAAGLEPTTGTSESGAYLDYALRTERWLRQQTVTLETGQIWRSADEKNDHPVSNGNLYYGSSGIILFYLELYQQTGEEDFLRQAEQGAAYLMATVPEALYFQRDLNALELFPSLNQPAEGGLPVYTAANGLAHPNQASLYWGVSGIGFTLGELYRVTGSRKYRHSAREIVDLLIRDHLKDPAGASWGSTPELMVGDVGAGLFLLYASRELSHPGAETLARAIGDSVLARARASDAGLMWPTRRIYGTDYPNFSHGSAGVGHFLATLYQRTRDERYLVSARSAGRYLAGIAHDNGLIAHHLPDDDGLVYYGWCHGPAGTNRLFEKLAQESPSREWSDFVERANRSVMAANIFNRKTAGFWENVGQCCGSAGVANYFLQQHAKTKKPEYLAFARAATEDILRHATVSDGAMSWSHAEHRSFPAFTQTLTGYMQGAAGIGMHFLRMHAFVNQKPLSIRLLDERP